jgi:hypothetical protein
VIDAGCIGIRSGIRCATKQVFGHPTGFPRPDHDPWRVPMSSKYPYKAKQQIEALVETLEMLTKRDQSRRSRGSLCLYWTL